MSAAGLEERAEAGAYAFLLDLDDGPALDWLSGFLRGERPEPVVSVPADLLPVEHLLGAVAPMRDGALPGRVGTLAGRLLARRVALRSIEPADEAEMRALFALVESLPVAAGVEAFLADLGAARRLVPGPGVAFDGHLAALRALVAHQRPEPGAIRRQVELWRGELADPRYAAVALQGLLRLSVPAALDELPGLLERHAGAPVADAVFAVATALGDDAAAWRGVARSLDARAVERFREAFRLQGLDGTYPAAWQAMSEAEASPEPAGDGNGDDGNEGDGDAGTGGATLAPC